MQRWALIFCSSWSQHRAMLTSMSRTYSANSNNDSNFHRPNYRRIIQNSSMIPKNDSRANTSIRASTFTSYNIVRTRVQLRSLLATPNLYVKNATSITAICSVTRVSMLVHILFCWTARLQEGARQATVELQTLFEAWTLIRRNLDQYQIRLPRSFSVSDVSDIS